MEKVDITTEFCLLDLVLTTKFQLKLTILISTKFAQKGFFLWKNGKSEHHHCIPDIAISLVTEFRLKLEVLVFWTKLPKKGISGRKRNK